MLQSNGLATTLFWLSFCRKSQPKSRRWSLSYRQSRHMIRAKDLCTTSLSLHDNIHYRFEGETLTQFWRQSRIRCQWQAMTFANGPVTTSFWFHITISYHVGEKLRTTFWRQSWIYRQSRHITLSKATLTTSFLFYVSTFCRFLGDRNTNFYFPHQKYITIMVSWTANEKWPANLL